MNFCAILFCIFKYQAKWHQYTLNIEITVFNNLNGKMCNIGELWKKEGGPHIRIGNNFDRLYEF